MKKRAYLFILAAAVLWGTTGTAQALAPQSAQPLAIGSLRLLVGALPWEFTPGSPAARRGFRGR